MFLFLLEHVPAGPCGCASGNHEVKTITDITLAFHHVHTEDLLSFAGPANTPTKNSCSSQIIWVGRFWFQDNCIFPAAPHSHRRDHMEPPPVLWSDRVPLLTCWTPSLRAGSPHPEDSKISFLWRACLLVRKINRLREPSAFTCSVCVKDPSCQWWPLLLWPVSPGVQSFSKAQSLRAKVHLCKLVEGFPTAIILLLLDE